MVARAVEEKHGVGRGRVGVCGGDFLQSGQGKPHQAGNIWRRGGHELLRQWGENPVQKEKQTSGVGAWCVQSPSEEPSEAGAEWVKEGRRRWVRAQEPGMRMERCGMFLSCKVLEGLSRMTCSDLGGPRITSRTDWRGSRNRGRETQQEAVEESRWERWWGPGWPWSPRRLCTGRLWIGSEGRSRPQISCRPERAGLGTTSGAQFEHMTFERPNRYAHGDAEGAAGSPILRFSRGKSKLKM